MADTERERGLYPNPAIDVEMNNLKEFFQYIYSRHWAWYNRTVLKLERPWSSDPWVAEYKFCNVYRELDRSSQWLIKNVFLDKSNDIYDLIFKIFVFRIYNKPETFEIVEMPSYRDFSLKSFLKGLEEVKKHKIEPLNTKAYCISTWSLEKGEQAYSGYARYFLPQLHFLVKRIVSIISDKNNTPEGLIQALRSINGIGVFLSHEYYIDFSYLRRYVDESLFPWTEDDWTHILPGSNKGIRYIFPSLTGDKAKTQGMYVLRDIASGYLDSMGKFPYLGWDKKRKEYTTSSEGALSVHQIEFNLCEYQKLKRLKANIGRIQVFEQRTY